MLFKWSQFDLKPDLNMYIKTIYKYELICLSKASFKMQHFYIVIHGPFTT